MFLSQSVWDASASLMSLVLAELKLYIKKGPNMKTTKLIKGLDERALGELFAKIFSDSCLYYGTALCLM